MPWISSATAWRTRSPTSAPASSGIRRTTSSARTWTRICSSGRCCAWCTGCCSGSSPRTATCCCTRTRTRPPGPGTRSTTPRARLRTSALRRIGTSHGDLWRAVRLVFNALGDEDGLPRLGLAGLGGIYDDTGTDQILRGLELSNEHLLAAVKSLARVYDKSARRWRRVDYQNLGAEELGSIYESLLELVPKWSKEKREFLLDVMAGNERKSTGSYYTPTSLIDCLLDSTLDPVLDDAQKRAEVAATNAGTDPSLAIADALLAVTVCDPACGSGHFLVAAARRIAKRLAAVREHNPEPTVEALRTALRDVVKHCIYGVDVNPMAVELAKVSLWLEALEPGKPLGFLDAHIKCGNALIGATPALIDQGIPDEAFKPVEGDDPQWAARSQRANANDRPDEDELFSDRFIFSQSNEDLAARAGPDRRRAGRLAARRAPPGRRVPRLGAITGERAQPPGRRRLVRRLRLAQDQGRPARHRQPGLPGTARAGHRGRSRPPPPPRSPGSSPSTASSTGTWSSPTSSASPTTPIPRVDPATGWSGGFTCVLGNPPWDKVDFEDKKYFSMVEPSIAVLAGQTRRARIADGSRRTRTRPRATAPRAARSSPRSCSPAARARSRCAPRG